MKCSRGLAMLRSAFRGLLLAFMLGLSAGAASAHEFWIAPERYKVDAGQPLVAALLTGDKFDGYSIPFIPEEFKRFHVLLGDKIHKVTGRLGDDPALNMAVPGEGLGVIVHQTSGFFIEYKEPGEFEALLRDKGVLPVLEAHRKRGLPEKGFRERFIRFAKCLVAVEHGRGRDTETGLETEFVAGLSPYADDVSGGMPFQLLYQQKPKAGAQVEVFIRAPDGEVSIEKLRTDREGRVMVAAKPGHEYLLSSVTFRPLEEPDLVWESLWAQFSYIIPPKG